ncbi:MAG TPA: poly-beta-1,6-N-acetyl-D-glucosamine N-deacetylase PgaB, partial [Candidatus Sulfotelmatobacter sp.]|nr:poly-beta-1,6-N-acetyl-D-glucosamine N-deacetylase PgaB [Candidatus Sulfotelmatobacter sp.]
MTVVMLALLVAGAPRPALAAATGSRFLALCYHDVQDADPDQTFVGVTTARLVEQLSWLQRNGYRFVSVDDLLAARDGRRKLPDKAVLLTFDDGLESFYTRALPILKAFRAPAVLALVGEWLAAAPGTTVAYGDAHVPRDTFLGWDQVREIARSGLVEIASHTFNLHRGIASNPQGNTEPAVVTRRYDPKTGAYEDEAAYDHRLAADADAETHLFVRELGRAPRVLVWPYGERNQAALSIEAAHGLAVTFTLADGMATVDRLAAAPRHLITPDPVMDQYVSELRELSQPGPQRAVQIDLDDVYDRDPAQQERNLDRLIQRVQDMEITTVFLQAFADPDGSGLAKQVYFPNRELPMRADLFNRVSWQLRTRAHVKVFAWMPVLAFDLDPSIARV